MKKIISIKDFLIEQVELIEQEFKNTEYDTLFNKVWNLIMDLSIEKYESMNKEDRFDYLVNNIKK